jgi:hypothetical protein
MGSIVDWRGGGVAQAVEHLPSKMQSPDFPHITKSNHLIDINQIIEGENRSIEYAQPEQQKEPRL